MQAMTWTAPPHSRQVSIAVIRTAFVQEDQDQARTQWRETVDKLRDRFPKLSDLMDEAEDDVLAFMHFPRQSCHFLLALHT